MEEIRTMVEQMGYATENGIGSAFEFFVLDTEENKISCVLCETFSAVSNLDVETNNTPEFFECDADDKDAIMRAVESAMYVEKRMAVAI